ncbi:MAG: hypothetical protein ABI016_15035 [Chthoniobacterales bacterium]
MKALVRNLTLTLALLVLPAASYSQLAPEWITRVPVGNSLTAGIQGFHVDADGTSYMTGISGPSPNTDITTVSLAPDGTIRWSQTWNSVGSGADQARGIAMGPDNVLYVVGNTPGPQSFANVLVLAYDAATGLLLDTIQYSSAPGTSEFGESIVADSAGNIYISGGTVGDGLDVMTLKFNAAGDLQWRRTWDGPAFAPFSTDVAVKVLLDLTGDLLVLIEGVQSSQHPDYEVVKYAGTNGATRWEANWGVTGFDAPSDMEIDALGDIYVTGLGIDSIDKISTIKLNGSNGQLLWQFYDAVGLDHGVGALFLDGTGGVIIDGNSDPDGDQSNFNNQFYTIKRDALTGALLWTHIYGDTCVGCYDIPSDVGVDSAGNVIVLGSTSSPPFNNDKILLVLDNATGFEINRGLIFHTGSEILSSGSLRFDSAFNVYDGGSVYNADTGAVNMSDTKWTSLVAAGGGIPCADVKSFQARCKAGANGDRLQIRVTLTDTSHSGEMVTVGIDGEPFILEINGNRAQLTIPGSAGSHMIELINPAGCFPPVTPTCQAN